MKLKIRKLAKEREELTTRMNEVTTILAILAHRNNGILDIRREEYEGLPKAEFILTPSEDNIQVKLNYIDVK